MKDRSDAVFVVADEDVSAGLRLEHNPAIVYRVGFGECQRAGEREAEWPSFGAIAKADMAQARIPSAVSALAVMAAVTDGE